MAVEIAAEKSKVQNGAWWTLASGIALMIVTGSLYGFGTWSPSFKDPKKYGYDQQQLEVMVTMSHLGNYIVLDSGILVSKVGTATTMAIGCAYAGVGYLGLWLALSRSQDELFPLSLVGLFCLLYGHGCGTLDNAVMTEAISDFPAHRGNVVGCLKACVGLAPAVVGVVYMALFQPERPTVLLLLGCYAVFCGLTVVPVAARTKGLVDENLDRVRCKFNILAAGLVALAALLFFVQLRREEIEETAHGWTCILVTVIAAFAALLLLPLRGSEASSFDGSHQATGTALVLEERLAVPLRNVSGLEMLCCLDFYILISVLVIGQGNGLMFISNAPQILAAFSDSSHGATSFVAVVSVFNAMGRLSFGTVSEWLKTRVIRPWFLVLATFLLFAAYGILVLEPTATMAWMAAAIVGFGYGGLWAIQPPLLSDIFGPKDYGFKYACSAIAALIGSLIFNGAIAGPLYETAAEELGEAPYCLQPICFRPAARLAAAADLPAMLLALWLIGRCRWLYEGAEEDTDDESSSSSSFEDSDISTKLC